LAGSSLGRVGLSSLVLFFLLLMRLFPKLRFAADSFRGFFPAGAAQPTWLTPRSMASHGTNNFNKKWCLKSAFIGPKLREISVVVIGSVKT
jgi:hypothetical protein